MVCEHIGAVRTGHAAEKTIPLLQIAWELLGEAIGCMMPTGLSVTQ